MKILFVGIFVVFIFIVAVPLMLTAAGINFFSFDENTGAATLFLSSDGGKNFVNVGISEDPAIPFPRRVSDIVFDPGASHRVWLLSHDSGLWRSESRGATWKKIFDTAHVLIPAADIRRMVIPRADERRLFVAAFFENRGSVLRSDDGGKSFQELYRIDGVRISDLYVDPQDVNHFRITTSGGELLESFDGGNSWSVIRRFNDALEHLWVNARNSADMYVITSRGTVWRHSDNAEWREITSAIGKETSEGATRAASLNGAALPSFSSNFASFFSSLRGFGGAQTFAISPGAFDTIASVRGAALFRSDNGGASWQEIGRTMPLNSRDIATVTFSHRDRGMLFAAVGPYLYSTESNGARWNIVRPRAVGSIEKIWVHPKLSEVIFVLGNTAR